MSKPFSRLVVALVLMTAVVSCSSSKKKVIGTWVSQDGKVVIRFDGDGRYSHDAEFAKFSAPWHMDDSTTIATRGYEYCENCGLSGELNLTDRRLKVGFAGDSLTLTDAKSGDVLTYKKTADSALSWKPSGDPGRVEFERKSKN